MFKALPMPNLFDSVRLGAIDCPNRILMAPMTRCRATADHVPTDMMAEYYAQRASAGLIISEATGISREGTGWTYVPGIWNSQQIDSWRKVTQRVHGAGGRIMLQLWHMGRLVHPSFNDGKAPVSSSATTAARMAHTYQGKQPYAQARALTVEEIGRIAADYAQAAENAMSANFDGVQIHAANGYLIDQFLRDSANLRTDEYGGSIANRIRFLVEMTAAVVAAVGGERTSVRLSPNGSMQGVNDSQPDLLFPAAAKALSGFGLSFLELREPGFDGTFGKGDHPPIAPAMRAVFDGPMVLNSDYTFESARSCLEANDADAIAFGRPFVENPDLPERFRTGADLNPSDMSHWYGQGPEGYTDFAPMSGSDRGVAQDQDRRFA
jgi:2,4-dienoyl-CoA reductase-like NADH-dependent reductase (Old Yellow Enzyme family)